MAELVSTHYDGEYFKWQASIGEFGGWANQTKFRDYISSDDRVLDFGCGGGFLLRNLKCGKRVGVEVNPAAFETARRNGIEVFARADDVPDDHVDVVISNHALEHALRPLDELKALYRKLRRGGKIVFVVPCEAISTKHRPDDVNHHLYTWSPMCLGNLFSEAGFHVIESKAYIHKWPPLYRYVAALGRRPFFELACRIYGHLARSSFQVRVVAEKR
jgi:SAM-dependent methyltransferase